MNSPRAAPTQGTGSTTSPGSVVTTPCDVVLPVPWVGAARGEFILKHARFRFHRLPSGDLEGEAGGYRPIDNSLATLEVGGPGVASTAGVECASVRKTLRTLADGDRDPKTGQCASISQSLDFAAKPSFVFEHGVMVASPRGKIGA